MLQSPPPHTGPFLPRIEARCSGAPFELGLAQGEAVREKIIASRAALAGLEGFRQNAPRWLPFPWYHRIAECMVRRALKGPLERSFPEMSARLRGLARGSGVSPATLYLTNAMEPLLSSLGRYTETPALTGCSALAVRDSSSASGEPVITRNFDYLPEVQPLFVLRETCPVGKFRSLDFTIAPLAGAVDGLNERGLTITYNYAYALDAGDFRHQARAGRVAPLSMLISEALGQCSTVEEAVHWITLRPRWGSGLLMLADARGQIASLEISTTRAWLRAASPSDTALYHTNCFTSASMRAVELPPQAVFSLRAPAALRGRRVLASSFGRNQRLAQLLGAQDRLYPDDLARILADHGDETSSEPSALCVHGPAQCTTAILQYFPCSRRLRASYSPACQASFAEFQLE